MYFYLSPHVYLRYHYYPVAMTTNQTKLEQKYKSLTIFVLHGCGTVGFCNLQIIQEAL